MAQARAIPVSEGQGAGPCLLSPFVLAKVPCSLQDLFSTVKRNARQIMVTEAQSREIRRYFVATQAMQVHGGVPRWRLQRMMSAPLLAI